MFFYLSKLAWFFLQPLNFAILLIGLSLVAAAFAWRRVSAASAALSFAILVLASWTSLGAMLLNPLEDRFPRPQRLPQQVDGIVVLGGGLEGAVNLARGGYELNRGGDRFVETAVLARRYPEARILISGGTGSVLLKGEGDADTAPRLLEALGIERSRLILENRSRNTHENAVLSKEMAQPKPGEIWLLVTSAFHMPRAIGIFRKAGFQVVPWPVDYRTSGLEGVGVFRDYEIDALHNAVTGIREWIGLLAYFLSGRTDTLLPGPEG